MLSIVRADDAHREAALSLLFSRLSAAERVTAVREAISACARGELDLDGLLLATNGSRPAGAALYTMQLDGTALVWPPVAAGDAEAGDETFSRTSVEDALLQSIIARIDASGAWIGQSLLDPTAEADRAALVRNGFEHLTDLSFLERSLRKSLPRLTKSRFECIGYDETSAERFARVVERTYESTLDCPSLNGLRTGAEALACHRSSGVFDPTRWTLYVDRDRDAGVLLFNEQPERNAWEVVYMGVVPEARGRGLGAAMLTRGFHEAKVAGRSTVLLAVDSANIFARRVYDELGFTEAGRQAVHARRGTGRPIVE